VTAREAVLAAARLGIEADASEEGFARIRAIIGVAFPDAMLADAVADCVRERLVRDPVRLRQGTLQCRWELELAD